MGSEKHERLPSETPVGVARPSTGLSGAHLGLTLGTLKTGTPTTSTSAKGAAAQASETREGSSDQEQAGALPGNGETLNVDAAAEGVYERPTDRLQVRTGTELPAKSPPKGQKQRHRVIYFEGIAQGSRKGFIYFEVVASLQGVCQETSKKHTEEASNKLFAQFSAVRNYFSFFFMRSSLVCPHILERQLCDRNGRRL